MSHVALQRVHVRMLHDPAFVARVYENPEQALAGLNLTAEERGWLVATDRRAWTADALRPRRVLKALMDEYKGSSALAVAATRRLATLDGFFRSAHFHDSVQQRGSMAEAFGSYLAQVAPADPRIAAVARIEQGLARARRGRAPGKSVFSGDNNRYRISSHVDPIRVPAGTLEVLQAVERVLFEITLAPVAALADDGPSLDAVPPLRDGFEHYLAEQTARDQAGLGEAPESLVQLLEFARPTRTGAELVAKAAALGAGAEARSIVAGLVADGLLAPA